VLQYVKSFLIFHDIHYTGVTVSLI